MSSENDDSNVTCTVSCGKNHGVKKVYNLSESKSAFFIGFLKKGHFS